MVHHFSPQLIKRAQKIFEKRSGRVVSADEAEIYLEQLAKIGNIASKLWEIYKQKNKL